MNYSCIHSRELTPDLVSRWSEIQQLDPAFANPYFCPEFTQAVASVRDDVFIGLIEDGNNIDGFFPFHRKRLELGRPIGLGLSDYHGVIARPGTPWTVKELLRACELVRWDFDHVPELQAEFAPFHREVSSSPIIDVSRNLAVFHASRDKSGRKYLREIERKQEKLEERFGPIRFTLHTEDQSILDQLVDWKSMQCGRTGTFDFFAMEWCRGLVEQVHRSQGPGFGGLLSCLHVDHRLAAVHFGMRSDSVWHSWFPAYNQELDACSPGSILLWRIIQDAAKQGISYIDLGKGMSPYKKRVMTGQIMVTEGSATVPSFTNRMRSIRERAEQWSRQSFLKPVLRIPGRLIQKLERKNRYD